MSSLTRNSFIPLLFLLVVGSCTYKARDPKKDEYLDTEIADRFRALCSGAATNDPLTLHCDSISKAVNNILLMTADIENKKTFMVKANSYFVEQCNKLGLDTKDIIPLTDDVPLEELIRTVKLNEIQLLNKMILKSGKHHGDMMPAR